MLHEKNKAARLRQIEDLLLAHPRGLSQSELARRLGVNRSTISRYLPDLPEIVYVDDDDGGKWKIDRKAFLVNVRFTLNEAMAIHLASRLLATRMDRANPHAASALTKLGLALQSLAPQISNHIAQSACVMCGEDQKQDPVYLQALENLTLAWAENKKVRVWYRSERDGELHEYIYSPYFIEPYAIGQTTYIFGLREPEQEIRTFKIERIEKVEMLEDGYNVPEDFNPQEFLSDAWGIWYTGDDPVEVVLKFHPRVAHRVRETRWHRSEQTELQEDGSLLWRALIAEPREMMPWVRGWGADVEVISPEAMRNELIEESCELMKLYSPR